MEPIIAAPCGAINRRLLTEPVNTDATGKTLLFLPVGYKLYSLPTNGKIY